MKGINPLTASVNPFTQSVKRVKIASVGVPEAVLLSNLITVTAFCRECGLSVHRFLFLRRQGRAEGLVLVAGKWLIDRSKINIRYRMGGQRFRRWLELGGRLGPVSVRENPILGAAI